MPKCFALVFCFLIVSAAEAGQRTIVLTFDDGPRREVLLGTRGLLALLEAEHIRAPFFVQGWQATANPDVVKEISKHHRIANHTNGHATPREWAEILAKKALGKKWKALTKNEQETFLLRGREKFLEDADFGRDQLRHLGYEPIFLRPPKWAIDQELYCELFRHGHVVQMLSGGVRDAVCSEVVRLLLKKIREERGGSARDILNEVDRRDVNTEDYAVQKWLVDTLGMAGANACFSEQRNVATACFVAVEKVRAQARAAVRAHEHAGASVSVLVFHEFKLTTEALRVLIPEWRVQGYQFRDLLPIYNIPERK